jgi:hypothetical protein
MGLLTVMDGADPSPYRRPTSMAADPHELWVFPLQSFLGPGWRFAPTFHSKSESSVA